MDTYAILTLVGGGLFGILASSGFWAFIMSRQKSKSSETKLLLGLACDRIVSLGLFYIERGWITKDEYETLHDYLFVPYKDCNGDGTAERVMAAVEKLEVRANPPTMGGKKHP